MHLHIYSEIIRKQVINHRETMIRYDILEVALFLLVVVLHPHTEGQVIPIGTIPLVPVAPFAPRPLCNYQIALANQACAYLPFIQVPPPAPRAPFDLPPSDDDTPKPKHEHKHGHGSGHGHAHGHEHGHPHGHDHGHAHEHEHRHTHEHGHEHENRQVHDEDPDPDPDRGHDNDDDHDHDHDDDHDHDHDHDHDQEHKQDQEHKKDHDHKRRHHHHHHRYINTPVEEQCCKWLAQVDDQCVCELLVHLPPFLARPVHNYAVEIGKACHFTFACGSGFRK